MKVLVACEQSQTVASAFRKIGHEAYSCDILPCGGNFPAWHLQQSVIPLLGEQWDLVIAFPPCTHLCVSGARWFAEKRLNGQQKQGIDFFMAFTELNCLRVVIENPVGIMSRQYRKPDQIIQPWQFGDEASKKTCLWLKGLPKLIPTNVVGQGEHITYASGCKMPKWYADAWRLPKAERSVVRSKTFNGIANAMAIQWGNL